MAGESIDLDAGVYGAVQAAASGPKDLPRRGKDKQGQKVRLWHLHATERAATLPHPAVAMNAHVAKGAAAAQLLSSPEGQPTSPDTPPTYRMPATTLVTGTRRQRRGRRGSKQIASSSHTAPPNASSCSLPCPDSSFAPGRHDRQQVYRTHPQLSASLPPVIGVLSTTKRTAKASAALPTPCPRGRVTGAPIRGLAAPPTVAPTPCRRVRALGGMARDAPEHNAHSSNLASHVVRLLVPLAPAIAPTPTAKQAHRPALESFSLRATPPATLRAAARKGRPTAGRHGKCPGTPVAHHHQHHHLVHHCRGRGRRRQAVGASRPLPRWPPPPEQGAQWQRPTSPQLTCSAPTPPRRRTPPNLHRSRRQPRPQPRGQRPQRLPSKRMRHGRWGGGACERAVGERRPSRRPQSRLGRLAVLTEATEQGAPFQDAVQNTVGFLHGQVNLPETRRP